MTAGLQTIDNQSLIPNSLEDFFRSKATQRAESSAKSYTKAIRSLTGFLRSRNLEINHPQVFTGWVIALWQKGITYKTACLYVDILSSLCVAASKENLLPLETADRLTSLRTRLKAAGDRIWAHPFTAPALDRVLSLLRLAHRQPAPLSLPTDIILLALLRGGTPSSLSMTSTSDLSDQSDLTDQSDRSDQSDPACITGVPACGSSQSPSDLSDAINAILLRQSSPRRKYLFNLDQSRRTPAQLRREVNRLFAELARQRNIPFTGDADQTVEAIWSMFALRVGASPSEIVAHFGHVPDALPILGLAQDSEPESARVGESLIRLVASTILDNPYRWYAMRLRPHVTLDEVKTRIELCGEEITPPTDLFYPHEEIAKRIGKKLVFKQKPFINDVVFIRSRQTDLLPLFARIGDLAWCYTLTGKPGSPYAAITPLEFNRFQTTIGQFTADTQVQPLNTIQPRPGEPVIVLAGPFQGREAIVDSLAPGTPDPASPTAIYRLRLLADNGLEWRVSLPGASIAGGQYRRLPAGNTP